MDGLLYLVALGLVKFLQALPLRWVARIGRAGGALAWWLDARHRRVALENLASCFGAEKPAAEIRALARENIRRLGENYCSAVKTAVMTPDQLRPHFEFVGAEKIDWQPGCPNERTQDPDQLTAQEQIGRQPRTQHTKCHGTASCQLLQQLPEPQMGSAASQADRCDMEEFHPSVNIRFLAWELGQRNHVPYQEKSHRTQCAQNQ